MPINDKTVTIRGAQVVLTNVSLFPQPDGKCVIDVSGATVDAGGSPVGLSQVRVTIPAGVAAIDNLLARALRELRLVNGLET